MTLSRDLDRLPRAEGTAGERFRQALALFEDGVALERMKLRRRFPEHAESEIEKLLLAWLAREDGS